MQTCMLYVKGAGRRHNQYGCHLVVKRDHFPGVKDDMEADKRLLRIVFSGA